MLTAIALLNIYSPTVVSMKTSKPRVLTYSQLRDEVEKGNIETAGWQEEEISGTLKDGKRFSARVPGLSTAASEPLVKLLDQKNVNWKIDEPPLSNSILGFLSMFAFPIILFLAIYLLFIRPAQMGGGQALSFGRSRAKRVGETAPNVTFDDVAGIDEAKQELFEVVDFLKNTKKYVDLGAKIPKGILLTGPPGVGKTHLSRAIAGEAHVPFYYMSGSDFVEMFVGVGAARVRDLFETAKANRPCVIFIDEIDAVGRQRGAGLGGGHDEREQTLNQLLVEMDGFEPNLGIILVAATNRPDVLDPALLRPGRFDRQIVIDPPDVVGREAILKVHSKGKPLGKDVKLATIARRTSGFTGADLENTLNESALLAARKSKAQIEMEDIEEALDRVIAGPQRKSRVMTQEEREVIAYHEAGHAIIGELLAGCHPVHKITILPRGMSLGSTWALPEKDQYLVSKEELLDEIAMTLGGRVAEEVVFGKVWTGASNDLERVARIAHAMVCEYGMSEKLGTVAIGKKTKNPFLGRDVYNERDYSEDVAKQIDEEVHCIVEKCHHAATSLLSSNREKLNSLVKILLEKETLNRDEFLRVLDIPDRKTRPQEKEDSNKIPISIPQAVPEIAPKARKGSPKPSFEPGTAV